jgi:hypothetical protein
VLNELDAILHQRTNARPEEILEYYLRSAAEKKVVHFRRRVPVAGVASAAVLIAATALAIAYGPVLSRLEWPLPFVKVSVRPPDAAPVSVAPVRAAVPPPAIGETRALPQKQVSRPAVQNSGSAAPGIPGRAGQTAAPKKQSPLEELTAAYGTSDLMTILSQETAHGKYQSALMVHNALPAAAAISTEAMIYKLRALRGLGDQGQLFAFFNGQTPDDAEVHLARAQFLCNSRRYAEAMSAVDRARSAPAALADKKDIEQDALYYRARCRTGLFEATPTPENRQGASEAWFDVKFAFRGNQGHRYYHEANEQIRRMADLAKAAGN